MNDTAKAVLNACVAGLCILTLTGVLNWERGIIWGLLVLNVLALVLAATKVWDP